MGSHTWIFLNWTWCKKYQDRPTIWKLPLKPVTGVLVTDCLSLLLKSHIHELTFRWGRDSDADRCHAKSSSKAAYNYKATVINQAVKTTRICQADTSASPKWSGQHRFILILSIRRLLFKKSAHCFTVSHYNIEGNGSHIKLVTDEQHLLKQVNKKKKMKHVSEFVHEYWWEERDGQSSPQLRTRPPTIVFVCFTHAASSPSAEKSDTSRIFKWGSSEASSLHISCHNNTPVAVVLE